LHSYNKNQSSPKIFNVFSAKRDQSWINSFKPNLKEAESDAGEFLLSVFSRLKMESTGKLAEISLATKEFQTK